MVMPAPSFGLSSAGFLGRAIVIYLKLGMNVVGFKEGCVVVVMGGDGGDGNGDGDGGRGREGEFRALW